MVVRAVVGRPPATLKVLRGLGQAAAWAPPAEGDQAACARLPSNPDLPRRGRAEVCAWVAEGPIWGSGGGGEAHLRGLWRGRRDCQRASAWPLCQAEVRMGGLEFTIP